MHREHNGFSDSPRRPLGGRSGGAHSSGAGSFLTRVGGPVANHQKSCIYIDGGGSPGASGLGCHFKGGAKLLRGPMGPRLDQRGGPRKVDQAEGVTSSGQVQTRHGGGLLRGANGLGKGGCWAGLSTPVRINPLPNYEPLPVFY